MNAILSALGLRFDDKATEAAFRADFARAVLPIQRGALIVALIVMLLFTSRDIELTEAYGPLPLFFRLFVVVPILGISLWLTFSEFAIRHHQAFFFTLAVILCIAILSQFFLTPPKGTFDARYGFRTMSTLLLMVGIVGLSGLRFQYALVCGLIIIAGWFVNAVAIKLDYLVWPPSILHLTAMFLLTACINYWMERSLRRQFQARQALDVERRRADQILFDTMPKHAAQRLKRGDEEIADAFVEAIVVFADLVGFTDLSKRIGPRETVHVLNEVFTAFDDIVARHNLERVKTMGDGYLLVGGVGAGQTSAADETAAATLEMIAAVDRLARQLGLPLALRIGMHIGPVIGGVVGKQRPIYDYWGDTLNIAARLEATAEPGRIHCSEIVYWRLSKGWRIDRRGTVELKGYSTVPSYYLLGALSGGDNVVSLGRVGHNSP